MKRLNRLRIDGDTTGRLTFFVESRSLSADAPTLVAELAPENKLVKIDPAPSSFFVFKVV